MFSFALGKPDHAKPSKTIGGYTAKRSEHGQALDESLFTYTPEDSLPCWGQG